jgi:LPS export ABC transporter protein LptC
MIVRLCASIIAMLAIPGWLGAGEESPELEVEGLTFVSSRDNGNEVVLHALHATYRPDHETAYLRGVDARVTADDDGFAFSVRCDDGELDLKSNDFHARGNVSGRTDSGQYFATNWVRYEHEAGLLSTDAPVVITDETGSYRGGGFRYLVREKRFKLLGGASVVQEP